MKAFILIATIVLCSLACSKSNEQLIKEAVIARMIDPDSVKFGKITVLQNKACATYNAKNRFGGYIGDQQAYMEMDEGQWKYIMDIKIMTN